MSTTQAVSGSRIRQARLAAGLTQSQLARSVNTSERNIVRWETNRNVPRMKHLAAIAAVTGNDIGYFIETTGSDDESDPVMRLRKIRAELILQGRDDLAADLLRLIPDSLRSERGAMAPMLVVGVCVFLLAATGWAL